MEDRTQHGQDGAVIKAVTMPIAVEDPPEYVMKGAHSFSLMCAEGDGGKDPFEAMSEALKRLPEASVAR
ncbi:hypothetical protein [Burkholderia cenocepacia]|uniref:hypothetical protein n=1 Tax=Burkholderia cenocepacia TaxID=95486 RepID=UPI00114C86E4|nr:hypothetical protein [Burkholderia cenocepacia]